MKPLIRRLLVLEQVCHVEMYVESEDSPAAIVAEAI